MCLHLKRNKDHDDWCEVYGSLKSGNVTAKVVDKVSKIVYCRKSEIPHIWSIAIPYIRLLIHGTCRKRQSPKLTLQAMNCDICNILEYYGDPRTLSQLIKNPFWQELTDGRRYYHKKLHLNWERILGFTSENVGVPICKALYFKIQVFSPSPPKAITKKVAKWVCKCIC